MPTGAKPRRRRRDRGQAAGRDQGRPADRRASRASIRRPTSRSSRSPFDQQGGAKFAKLTSENVNKPFAIILDGKVLSAPNINEPILGGSAQISGSFTVESANQLAIALRSGALPVDLKVVEERTVGPDLGAEFDPQGR